jgi:hypothetical protein
MRLKPSLVVKGPKFGEEDRGFSYFENFKITLLIYKTFFHMPKIKPGGNFL